MKATRNSTGAKRATPSIEPKITRVTAPYRYTSWTLEGHPDMLPGDLFAEFTSKACQLGSMLRAIRKVVESPLDASDDGRDNGPLLDLIEIAADLVDDVYGLVDARQQEGENALSTADEAGAPMDEHNDARAETPDLDAVRVRIEDRHWLRQELAEPKPID